MERGHGGRRPGAGRKPKGDVAGTSHRRRAAVDPRLPVHITIRLADDAPRLRDKLAYTAVCHACVAGCASEGFRLVHFAVHADAVHLLVEADDQAALTRGAQGLLIRIARGVNRVAQRSGKLYGDRYRDEPVRDKAALRALAPLFSPPAWVDGHTPRHTRPASEPACTQKPRTALLKAWRR